MGSSSRWETRGACTFVSFGISNPALVSFLQHLHPDFLQVGISDPIPEWAGLGVCLGWSQSFPENGQVPVELSAALSSLKMEFSCKPETGWSPWTTLTSHLSRNYPSPRQSGLEFSCPCWSGGAPPPAPCFSVSQAVAAQ